MTPPKMRPITIEILGGEGRVIDIEALTPEAEEWMKANAAQFGEIHSTGYSKSWHLFVYRGYDRQEVASYLIELWDSQAWPETLETEPEIPAKSD